MTSLQLPISQPIGQISQDQTQLSVTLYKAEYKQQWDNFVSEAKNSVFLFYRDYMEYHSSRFIDHSMLFFKGDRLVAVMPANLESHTLHSHAGLTFGGIISGFDMTQELMLEVFDGLVRHCREQGIQQVIYKTIPYIYHAVPAEEDLYALFKNNAHLIGRSVSSTVPLPEKIPFDSKRKESLRKARKNGLVVRQSYDLKAFMSLAEYVLMEKHGARPVHTVAELEPLMQRFPQNIKLFVSYRNSEMVAGIIIYESPNVAHGQYAANSDIGRKIGAQDIIEDYLINEYYRNKKFYDFGISTTKMGRELNQGLLDRKEGFGAAAINYDIYEVIVK
jgi:hypothetical protein